MKRSREPLLRNTRDDDVRLTAILHGDRDEVHASTRVFRDSMRKARSSERTETERGKKLRSFIPYNAQCELRST